MRVLITASTRLIMMDWSPRSRTSNELFRSAPRVGLINRSDTPQLAHLSFKRHLVWQRLVPMSTSVLEPAKIIETADHLAWQVSENLPGSNAQRTAQRSTTVPVLSVLTDDRYELSTMRRRSQETSRHLIRVPLV